MGQFLVVSGIVLAGIAMVGLSAFVEPREQTGPAQYVRADAEPRIETPVGLDASVTGSALATAAFGLSALQPETFNADIVRDIIEAAPIDNGEKDRLTAKLSAAVAGHADLPHVLSDIRTRLAVE